MKSEGIILVSVLGLCSLFGFGVSQVASPTIESLNLGSEQTTTATAETYDKLKQDLKANYPDIVIDDEDLASLACAEASGPFGQKSCYEGSTPTAKKYGKATITIKGETVTVQLASMPPGAFLIK